MIRDPRRGYVELPPYHPPVSQYYEQQNRIRNAYLRHLCPYRVDFPDEELPRNIALHHFHPEIVLECAQQRHLSSRKNKVPLTVTREEMERLQLGLGEEDRVLDPDGTPTSSYYFCPNYPMKNVQQDLKECVRRERHKRSQTEGTKKSSSDLKVRSRSHSRSRDESATKLNRTGVRSQSQSRAMRPESRGHSSKRSHELPPTAPQRSPALDDSGYGTGPGDAILNFTVAVPAWGDKLPPPPRDLKSPTPSDPSEGKQVARAKPDVLIVPEASEGSGSRGRVNVYINFDEEQKPAEAVARVPSLKKPHKPTMNEPVENTVEHVPHRHQSKRSKSKDADQMTDEELDAWYRKKKRKDKLRRKKREGALIIPTNIVLVCGRDTPDHTEGSRSEDVLMMNDHNTSTAGSMDEPIGEFSTPLGRHSGGMRASSPVTFDEMGVNPLHHKPTDVSEDDRVEQIRESNARHTRTAYMDDLSDMNQDTESHLGTLKGKEMEQMSRAVPNEDISFIAPKNGETLDSRMQDNSLDADREVARHIAAEMERVNRERHLQFDGYGSNRSVFEYLNSSHNDVPFSSPAYDGNNDGQQGGSALEVMEGSAVTNDYLSTSHSDILFVAPRYGQKGVVEDAVLPSVEKKDISESSTIAYEVPPIAPMFKKDAVRKFKQEIDSDLEEKSLGWDERSDERSRGMEDRSADTPYGVMNRARGMEDKSDDTGFRTEDRSIDGMDLKSDDGPFGMEDKSDDGPYEVDDKADYGPYEVDDKSNDGRYGMTDKSGRYIMEDKPANEGGEKSEDGLHSMDDRSDDGPYGTEDDSDIGQDGTHDGSDDGMQGVDYTPQGNVMKLGEEQQRSRSEDLQETSVPVVSQTSFKRAVSDPPGELLNRSAFDGEKSTGRTDPQSSPQSVADVDMIIPPIQEKYYDEMEMTPEHFEDLNSFSVAGDEISGGVGSVGEKANSELFEDIRADNGSVNSRAVSIYSTTNTVLFIGDVQQPSPFDSKRKDGAAAESEEQSEHMPSERRFESLQTLPKETVGGFNVSSNGEDCEIETSLSRSTLASEGMSKPVPQHVQQADKRGENIDTHVAAAAGVVLIGAAVAAPLNKVPDEPKVSNFSVAQASKALQTEIPDQALQPALAPGNQSVSQTASASAALAPLNGQTYRHHVSITDESDHHSGTLNVSKPNKVQPVHRNVDSRLPPDEESVECSSKGRFSTADVTRAEEVEDIMPTDPTIQNEATVDTDDDEQDARSSGIGHPESLAQREERTEFSSDKKSASEESRRYQTTDEAKVDTHSDDQDAKSSGLHHTEPLAQREERTESSSDEKSVSEESRRYDRSEESEETGELTKMMLAAESGDNIASVDPRLVDVNLDTARDSKEQMDEADLLALADIEALNFLELHANNQRLLDMLNVPMEIAFNKDDNSLQDVSVCFTESVMTSATDFVSPPPAKRKNLNELYGELIAWESKRRTRYASEIEETSIHWRCRKELLREGLLETAKAERLILGAAEAVKIFAETMQASYDDILIDDDGCILTDSRKQNKIMLQRQSEFYSLGNTGSSNVQEEKSALLDTLIKSQSVMSESFNQSAFVQNDVIEEMKNLRKQLQQQLSDFEKKGDRIVRGMKLAEEQVQKFWGKLWSASFPYDWRFAAL